MNIWPFRRRRKPTPAEISLDEYRLTAGKAGMQAAAEFSGTAVGAWAAMAVDWFHNDVGATGFVQLELTDKAGDRYLMTMQLIDGITPIDRVKKLETELAGKDAQMQVEKDALASHRQHVKEFLEELAPYLGLDGEGPYGHGMFITAAAAIRQWCSDHQGDADRVKILEAALTEMAGTYYYHARLLETCNKILRRVGLPNFMKPSPPFKPLDHEQSR